MRGFPTLLCDIPAEQLKPVCFSTADLISSTMRAPTVSCRSAELCSPDRGTGKDSSHCWTPLDLCSSGDKHDAHWRIHLTRVFAVFVKRHFSTPACCVRCGHNPSSHHLVLVTAYLYPRLRPLRMLPVQVNFVGTPGCRSFSAGEALFVCLSCFSAAAGLQQ